MSAGALLLTALAATPPADAATFYACVKKTGSARVFTKKPKCTKGETRVSWNAAGPAGKKGVSGATGAQGVMGATAAQGASGGAGGNGERGATGTTGSAGSIGASGVIGASGATGPAGSDGEKGATGVSGASGSAGSTGEQGATGAGGVTGAGGATGPAGSNGETGAAGATGKGGANGAVAGYSATHTASTELNVATEVAVVSKQIPAGNYIVSAKTVIGASAETFARVGAACKLSDTAAGVLDESQWTGGLVELLSKKWIGGATVSLGAAVSTTETTTLALECADRSNHLGELSIGATFSSITAIQTSSNS